MAQPTAQEQYFLELLNRARLNPLAEAQRYGIDLNQGLAGGTLTATQKQPLAFNFLLNDAADQHSSWMLATDTFSHTGINGSSPMQRMQNAGYSFTGSWWNGENIAYVGSTGSVTLDGSIDNLHRNLFLSAGHRENILNGAFMEAGVGLQLGVFTSGGTNWNAAMVTQDFALSGSNKFVSGVAYNDANADAFYSIGEGRGGITTTLKAGATVLGSQASWSAGGFSLGTTGQGGMTLEFSGGGLGQTVGASFVLSAESVKIDLINSSTIASTVQATLIDAAQNLTLLGINNISGTGNNLANIITGNIGHNLLVGEGGGDTLFGGSGNDTLRGGLGADTLNGGSGIDTAGYGTATSGVTVSLASGMGSAGEAMGDKLVDVENVNGSPYSDVILGSAIANVLCGYGGDDALLGGGGADYLDGGSGQWDRAGYGTATSAVVVSLATGKGTLGDALGDTLINIECLGGSNFNDQLTGNSLANILCGNGGNDVLAGGAGADRFDFNSTAFGSDSITDFADGVDKLCFYGGAATSFANFVVAHNGTTDVTLSCASGNVTLHGAAAITLTASDFLFL